MWEQHCLVFSMYLAAFNVAAYEYHINSAKTTWSEANEICKRNGSILAVVNSPQKIDELSTKLASLGYGNGNHKFWVGLMFNASIKEYVWSTGDIAKDSFINSACGISSNKNRNWCYLLKNSNNKKCFEQRVCSSPANSYICQSGSSKDNTTAETPFSVAATTSRNTGSSDAKVQPTITTSRASMSSTTSSKTAVKQTSSIVLHDFLMATSSLDFKTLANPRNTTSCVLHVQITTTSLKSSPARIRSENSVKRLSQTFSVSPTTTAPSLDLMTTISSRDKASSAIGIQQMMMTSTSSSSSKSSDNGLTDRVQSRDPVLEFINLVASLNPRDPHSLQLLTDAYEEFAISIESKTNRETEHSTIESSRVIEDFAFTYASFNLNASQNQKRIENQHIVLQVSQVPKDYAQNFSFFKEDDEGDVARITLPSYLFTNGDTLVVNVLYHGIHKTVGNGVPRDTQIDSMILGSSIRPSQHDVFTENVTIVLRTFEKNEINARKSCVFWKWDYSDPVNGSWSDDGCSLVESSRSHVVCTCNHLTNFAILMNIKKSQVPDQHRQPLAFITYIGLGLSLLGETITIFAYMLLLCSRHDQQSHIHVNLVATLATAQMIFLAGIEATQDQVLCLTVATLIHYFYLSSFCWMLMEGLMLYLLIIEVYNTELKLRYCYCFSFGFPGLIVGGTFLLSHLTDDGIYQYRASMWCWLSTENHYIWSFAAPVILITAVNLMVFCGVVKEMVSMPSAQSTKLNALKTTVKACIVLFPLLGVTWLFGLLSIAQAGVVPQYIFTVLNSLQGFLIFLLHCVRNSEIRSAWNKKLKNLKKRAWRLFKLRSPTHASTSEGQSNKQERPEMELGRKSNKIAPVEG